MIDDVKNEVEGKMKKALEVLRHDFQAMRTGRASPAIVEPLRVEYYGAPTPLQQLASVSVPEARLIVIKPHDPSTIKAIEKAILASDLGLTPNNDGKVIRLNIPSMTEESRRKMVKVVKQRNEEAHVAIRNIRHQGMDDLKEYEKEKMITEDEHKRGKEVLQKLTDRYIEEANAITAKKEEEVMAV
ncbi:MAG: ribosome recycling factor [Anaerolineae bacterium]|nr:ribosome recycling factor [Anaerolineae bacterium]